MDLINGCYVIVVFRELVFALNDGACSIVESGELFMVSYLKFMVVWLRGSDMINGYVMNGWCIYWLMWKHGDDDGASSGWPRNEWTTRFFELVVAHEDGPPR